MADWDSVCMPCELNDSDYFGLDDDNEMFDFDEDEPEPAEIPEAAAVEPPYRKFRIVVRKSDPEKSIFLEFLKNQGNREALSTLRPRPTTRSLPSFDIIIYINYHGVCAMPNVVKDNIFVPSYPLSMLRASSFGVASYRLIALNEKIVKDTLDKIMSLTISKGAVMLALQKMFRTHKELLDYGRTGLEKMDWRKTREDTMERNELGWYAIVDGVKFHDTTYYKGDGLSGCNVIYDKLGKVGLVSIDLHGKKLSQLVTMLEDKGYTNICIINDTCNSNAATPRQNVIAKKASDAFGGTRNKKSKRKRTKRTKKH